MAFGESPNPQEKREFPWGIMKYPPRQQHVRTLSTIRFYVSARLAGTNPMPGTGLRHARQCAGWQPAAYLPCPVTLEGLAKR